MRTWLLLPCAGLAAGCALPPAPGPAAAAAARRQERLQLMQRLWAGQTGAGLEAAPGGAGPAPADPAAAGLTYPAGVYDGLRFAPRLAPDSGLAEPPR